MEDYEELMLQISDVMREANRIRPVLYHEQAITKIRDIVERHGKWLDVKPAYPYPFKCSVCGHMNSHKPRYCSACGSLNNEDIGIEVWRGEEESRADGFGGNDMNKLNQTVEMLKTITASANAAKEIEGITNEDVRNILLGNMTTILGDIALSLAIIAEDTESIRKVDFVEE